MNNNGRPMGMRKTVQLLVILTILAWATQVLFHQWGYGAVIVPSRQALLAHTPNETRSAPSTVRTIELRPEIIATHNGAVALRDVCRWSEDDQAALSPYEDVIVSRKGGSVTVDQIKSVLADAGVDLKTVKFSGAARCAITAGSSETAELPARTHAVPADPASTATPTTQPQTEAQAGPQPEYFDDQLVLTRSLSSGQALIKSDIAIKHVKVDAPATQPSLSIDQVIGQVIGQVAARDLKAGQTIEAADVKAPQAITAGQFMTVSLNIGSTTVETVARAMNDGGVGETIEAKNEATGQVYTVQITGPNTAQQVTSSSPTSNDHNVATTDNGAN